MSVQLHPYPLLSIILIDSPSVEVKVAGVKYASGVGLEKMVVYNSLIPESKPEEFEALKEDD